MGPCAQTGKALVLTHSVLVLQFDYNVAGMPEGLDLAFGLTMAIVVSHCIS